MRRGNIQRPRYSGPIEATCERCGYTATGRMYAHGSVEWRGDDALALIKECPILRAAPTRIDCPHLESAKRQPRHSR